MTAEKKRRCRDCGAEKNIDQFRTRTERHKKTGAICRYPKSRCAACEVALNKAARRKWNEAYKPTRANEAKIRMDTRRGRMVCAECGGGHTPVPTPDQVLGIEIEDCREIMTLDGVRVWRMMPAPESGTSAALCRDCMCPDLTANEVSVILSRQPKKWANMDQAQIENV